MIRLERIRHKTKVPPSFRMPDLRKKAELLVELYYEARASAKPMAFKSSGWSRAKAQLKKDTNGKCAYCEANTEVAAHGDVEHFRPKSVYWWLAFSFDNYLYSCQICNQTYKSDSFPISGPLLTAPVMPLVKPTGAALTALIDSLVHDALALTDAQVSAFWQGEQGDLINPYFEDPEPLLEYALDASNEEILVQAAPGPRAARAFTAAHNFLGINREPLKRARYLQYLPLAMARIAYFSTDPIAKDAGRELLLSHQQPMQPFAGMSRWYARTWGLPTI